MSNNAPKLHTSGQLILTYSLENENKYLPRKSTVTLSSHNRQCHQSTWKARRRT